MKNLQERLREVLEAGYTQKNLATASGLTKAAINQMLSGAIKSIKLENAQGIELLTGFRAEWVVTGKGEQRGGLARRVTPPEETVEQADERIAAASALEGAALILSVYASLPTEKKKDLLGLVRDFGEQFGVTKRTSL
jgi:ParB-like chromosome segregation protein Spo0J